MANSTSVFPTSFPLYRNYPSPEDPGDFLTSLPALVAHPAFVRSFSRAVAIYVSFFFLGRAYLSRGQSDEYLSSKDHERRTSWLLTLLSCFSMTVGGFLVLPGFYSHRYDFAAYPLFGESDLSLHLAVAFLAYLFLDLSLGMLFYRSQMTILNGYFHHTIYSLMTLFAIHRRLPMVYLLYWPEELPMVLMSIGALNPAARVNMRFGLSYFVTRICWHIYLTASLWSHEMILGVLSLAVFPLNAYFFYGWVKQQLRKRGENRKKAKLEDDVESDAENETKTPGLRRRRTANTPVSSTESSEEKNNILESRSRFAKLRERLNAAWRRMRRKGRPQKMC